MTSQPTAIPGAGQEPRPSKSADELLASLIAFAGSSLRTKSKDVSDWFDDVYQILSLAERIKAASASPEPADASQQDGVSALVAALENVIKAWDSLHGSTPYVEGLGDRMEDLEFREMQQARTALASYRSQAAPGESRIVRWDRQAALEQIADERSELLAAKFNEQPFDAERLKQLDDDMNALCPRVTQDMVERLEATAQMLASVAAPGVQQAVAHTSERHFALREAHCIAALDAYFEPRPVEDGAMSRRAFEAGFTRGFDAGEKVYAPPPERATADPQPKEGGHKP